MNLESILKFHLPKSPRLSDESRGTSPDSLNTTDALTAAEDGTIASRKTQGRSFAYRAFKSYGKRLRIRHGAGRGQTQ